MSCPTCDHTMQMVATSTTADIWWCPRCGTIKDNTQTKNVPYLIDAARDLYEKLDQVPEHEVMRTLGIVESIWLPKDRPQ